MRGHRPRCLQDTYEGGLRGTEARLIRDHVTRAVRPDDAEIYQLLKPGDTYLDVPEHLRRYRSDTFDDKYLRLSFDDLSRTITAHIAKDGYWYIHPREDRTLSIREAARIQTFPDRFRFAGHPSTRYQQIGNAVPPMLASAIAASVHGALEDKKTRERIGECHIAYRSSFRDDLVGWFKRNRREFPWRRPDLNPWQTLLLEMCLHRTKAEQVAQVAGRTAHLRRNAGLILGQLRKAWTVIGLAGASLANCESRYSSGVRQGPSGRTGSRQLAGIGCHPWSGGLHSLRRALLRIWTFQCDDGHEYTENSPQGSGRRSPSTELATQTFSA